MALVDKLWANQFGDDYTERHTLNESAIQNRLNLWQEIFVYTGQPNSVLEVGPNTGANLEAIKQICNPQIFAVEPNEVALKGLLKKGIVTTAHNTRNCSADDIDFPDCKAEMCITYGVLIHIHPTELYASMKEIHRLAKKWIVCCEYFNAEPVTIPYRHNSDALFKRDFGSYWLDMFPDLQCRAYGFKWRRATGLDNITYWVFEKQ